MSQQQILLKDKEEQEKEDDRVFFSLLERAGSWGNYQIMLIVIMCLCGYVGGGFFFISPFLFYQDPYSCPSLSTDQCHKFVCTLQPEERLSYIPEEATIFSLASEFGDFRCDSERLVIQFYVSLMLFGKAVGPMIPTMLGDFMGRKRLMLGSLVLYAVGLALVLFSINLPMAGAGLFVSMCGAQNAFTIPFFFASQKVKQGYRQKFSIMIQILEGMGGLLNVAWAYFSRHWAPILWIYYLIPLVVCFFLVLFFVTDTPICLVTRYKPKKALRKFSHIAKINRLPSLELTEDQIHQVGQRYKKRMSLNTNSQNKKFTVIDLFRYKSIRYITILSIILHTTQIAEFYGPVLLLDQFNLSIFINGIVVGLSEVAAYPQCYYLVTRVGRKTIAYAGFGVTYIASMALLFVWKQGSHDSGADLGSSIAVLILIFIFRYAITVEFTIFYVYLNQLFPTQVRVLGFALLMGTGGLSLTVVPLLLELCLDYGVPIMAVFALLSGFSAYLSKFLPETLNQPPPQEIEELREEKPKQKKQNKTKLNTGSTVESEDAFFDENKQSMLSEEAMIEI